MPTVYFNNRQKRETRWNKELARDQAGHGNRTKDKERKNRRDKS